jgi:hypothetical protein
MKSKKKKRSSKMAAPKKVGKMKLAVIPDTGTALATVSGVVDAAGLPTTLPNPLVWTASDPGVVVTPVATDPTGLTATVGPSTPPVLVASFSVTATETLADGTTISATSDSQNSIVAGGPVGFQVNVS